MPTLRLCLVGLLVCAACSSSKPTATTKLDAAGSSDSLAGDASAKADGDGSDGSAAELPGLTDTAGNADSSAAPMQVSELCPALVNKQCAALGACGCPFGAGGKAACEAKQSDLCQKSMVASVGGTALGTLQFDPKAATECLAGFDAMAANCALPTDRVRPLACQALFIDVAKLGAPCAAYSAGLLCADHKGYCDSGKANSCTSLPAAGQPCPTARCASGLMCDAGTCRAPGAAAATCGSDLGCKLPLVCGTNGQCQEPGIVGAPCMSSGQCGVGLACSSGACAKGVDLGGSCMGDVCSAGNLCVQTSAQPLCRPKAKASETCDSWDACETGLVCDFQGGSVCKSLPGAGQPCPLRQCAAGLSCDTTSTCATGPLEGQGCLVGATPMCGLGLGCDEATGLCTKLGGDGSPCANGLCAPGSVCNYSVMPPKCIAPQAAGAACSGMDSACQAGLYCDPQSNLCQAAVAAGGACTLNPQCGAGSVCKPFNQMAPDGICVTAPAKVGEPCTGTCGGGLRCSVPDGTCNKGICAML